MGFLGNLGAAIASTIQNELGHGGGAPSPQGGTVANFGPANPQAQGSNYPVQQTPLQQPPNGLQPAAHGPGIQPAYNNPQSMPLGGQGIQGNANPMFHFNVGPAPQLQLLGGALQHGYNPTNGDNNPNAVVGINHFQNTSRMPLQGSPGVQAQNSPDILSQVRGILGY